jgi:hypothetical protein
MEKPSVQRIMKPIIEVDDIEKRRRGDVGGGLAVAVSGPETLSTEARNAIASMSLAEHRRFGKVSIHTEVFAI